MTVLWIDLETRSRCDLTRAGLYNYAAHPSTEIVVCSYAVDMGPVKRWQRFGSPSRPVAEVQNILRDKTVEIRAHSAAFERQLLKHVWKIDIPASRFHCTAFQSRSCALPGALADVGRALTARLQKDPRGYQLIRLLSIPREDGSFNEDRALYREFGDYCDQDVEAMRVASLMLPPLDDMARRVYTANEVVNDRGLPIDTELCEWAIRYADEEREAAQQQVVQLTSGACAKARGGTLTQWLYDHLPASARKLMEVVKRRAVGVRSGGAQAHAGASDHGGAGYGLAYTGALYDSLTLDAETRAAIFALAEEQPAEFDDTVIEVLSANDAATSASVYKFQSMLDTASADGRLRGAFIAAGASGTGRFSSHGAQLHNFPRVTAKDPEAVRKIMKRRGKLPGPVLEVLKSMLRPAIYAGSGRRIVRADWNAVEARALPWLTARASGVVYLDAFRDPTRDIYLEQAALVGLPGNRPAGKVVVLALGYGGAEGALAAMCKGYGVAIEGKRQVVQRWRSANRWAPEWWGELERTARTALRCPANPEWHGAGRVGFRSHQDGEVPGLRMMLPSGRCLYYPLAAIDEEGIRYLKAAWKPKADATEWPRARLWGGLAAENATQAACADLLREALVNAVEDGLPVIGHVHDELIGEAATLKAPRLAGQLSNYMLALPEWAKGLPLAVETDAAPRYRK